MMERLTHYQKNGEVAEPYNRSQASEFAKKLAQYEDLEEQGLLVRLPCKVGDTVYYISPIVTPKKIEEYTVTGLYFHNGEYQIRAFDSKGATFYLYFNFIGKTVFLTREEAFRKMEQSK